MKQADEESIKGERFTSFSEGDESLSAGGARQFSRAASALDNVLQQHIYGYAHKFYHDNLKHNRIGFDLLSRCHSLNVSCVIITDYMAASIRHEVKQTFNDDQTSQLVKWASGQNVTDLRTVRGIQYFIEYSVVKMLSEKIDNTKNWLIPPKFTSSNDELMSLGDIIIISGSDTHDVITDDGAMKRALMDKQVAFYPASAIPKGLRKDQLSCRLRTDEVSTLADFYRLKPCKFHPPQTNK